MQLLSVKFSLQLIIPAQLIIGCNDYALLLHSLIKNVEFQLLGIIPHHGRYVVFIISICIRTTKIRKKLDQNLFVAILLYLDILQSDIIYILRFCNLRAKNCDKIKHLWRQRHNMRIFPVFYRLYAMLFLSLYISLIFTTPFQTKIINASLLQINPLLLSPYFTLLIPVAIKSIRQSHK